MHVPRPVSQRPSLSRVRLLEVYFDGFSFYDFHVAGFHYFGRKLVGLNIDEGKGVGIVVVSFDL